MEGTSGSRECGLGPVGYRSDPIKRSRLSLLPFFLASILLLLASLIDG